MTNKKRAEFVLWMSSIIEDFLSSQDSAYNYTQWTPRRKCCQENQNFGIFLAANDDTGIVSIGQRDDNDIDNLIATFDFMGFTRRQIQSLCKRVVELTVTRWDFKKNTESSELEDIEHLVSRLKTPSNDISLHYDADLQIVRIQQHINHEDFDILNLYVHNWGKEDVKHLLQHAFQYLRY